MPTAFRLSTARAALARAGASRQVGAPPDEPLRQAPAMACDSGRRGIPEPPASSPGRLLSGLFGAWVRRPARREAPHDPGAGPVARAPEPGGPRRRPPRPPRRARPFARRLLFAYDSPIRNPLIEIAERRRGTLRGCHRRFCVWSALGLGRRLNRAPAGRYRAALRPHLPAKTKSSRGRRVRGACSISRRRSGSAAGSPAWPTAMAVIGSKPSGRA